MVHPWPEYFSPGHQSLQVTGLEDDAEVADSWKIPEDAVGKFGISILGVSGIGKVLFSCRGCRKELGVVLQ